MLAVSLAATMAACQPAATALTPDQIASVDRYIEAEMARQQIPGLALGVYRYGQAVLLKGYGLASIEHAVPVTADTVMQSGSIGKTFTAALVMMLVERDVVRLDDSIRAHMSDLPASWQGITIAHLLSHTSGLAEYDSPELTRDGGPFDVRRDFSEDQLIQRIAALPLSSAPGESWDYRNANYLVLGVLIRRVTGSFHGDMLKREVFDPLGMSSSRVISDREIVLHRAAGYQRRGGQIYNQDWVSPTFNSTADGTLYFTIRDIEKWDRALCENTLLRSATKQRMWTPFPFGGSAPSQGYGLGWFVRDAGNARVVEHDGAWQGFTSYYGRYLETGLSVAVLTNLDADHSQPDHIGHAVVGLIEPELMPAIAVAIEDDQPQLTRSLWDNFGKVVSGEAATGSYPLLEGDAADLRDMLPDGWDTAAPSLVARRMEGTELISTYKIGPAGNTRRLIAVSDANGQATNFVVLHDPDNR